MKAKINETGCLVVKRGPTWKIQFCQQDVGNAHPDVAEGSKCGDHCPHFFEKVIKTSEPERLELSIRCCPLEVVYHIEGDARAVADSTDDPKTDS